MFNKNLLEPDDIDDYEHLVFQILKMSVIQKVMNGNYFQKKLQQIN